MLLNLAGIFQFMNPTYQIAVILPHTQLFGGVKRFFELGELFISAGHKMTIFTPDGTPPAWCKFSGVVDKISNLGNFQLTILFITETHFLQDLLHANSRLKVFYHVGPRANLTEVIKHKEILIFSNSTNMYFDDRKKYGIETIKAVGGVHIPPEPKIISNQQDPFVVMCYGRLARKGKGTNIVVRATEQLYKKGYPIKLLLFDSPLDEKGLKQIQQFKPKLPFEFVINHPVNENPSLFKRANVFVAVEKKGGWSNTAAEALAAGVPLIASNTGTRDFLIDQVTGLKVWRHSFFVKRAILKLMNNIALQQQLANNGRAKMDSFSWESLSKFILNFLDQNLKDE